MKLDINMGTIWTMLAGTVVAVVYMFTNFVSAADFDEFKVDIYYGQFYDLLERFEDAVDDDRPELAGEFERQMERLKAKICEGDPEWERCEKDDGD